MAGYSDCALSNFDELQQAARLSRLEQVTASPLLLSLSLLGAVVVIGVVDVVVVAVFFLSGSEPSSTPPITRVIRTLGSYSYCDHIQTRVNFTDILFLPIQEPGLYLPSTTSLSPAVPALLGRPSGFHHNRQPKNGIPCRCSEQD
jgi:hypothetical protein